LIQGILKGNGELYAEIIERYQAKLYQTAFYYTRNVEEANDLTQEIFIKVYNKLAGFKRGSAFSTWLYRIAVNHCLDWCRQKKVEHDEDNVLGKLPDRQGGPEDVFLRREKEVEIQEAVRGLPEIYSTVLILYYFQDYSPQQIADILNISKRTVETRLFRGRKMLKERIDNRLSGGEVHELSQKPEPGRLAQLH